MRINLLFILALACISLTSEGNSEMATTKHPVVLIKTTAGDIKVELDAEKAPISTKNFLEYVNEGHYDGTIFHRVIDGFMVQGGGFTKDMKQKPTHAPIKIESDNGLKNTRGTLAMARTGDPNSATSQFFINVVDNKFLDFTSKTPSGYGYAVFGHVTEGMDVVDKIRKAKTGNKGPHGDVPVETIEIIEAKETK
jgi:peptidyl-prolyl cis-trans isomerase B (cyclophilin B)